jgi:4-hydroxy-2-oxoheptanedioate aldolase
MRLFAVPGSRALLWAAVAMGALCGTAAAQTQPKHLNPVIEKLAAGKPIIGFQSGDLSLEKAREMARSDIDYVYLEMEHGPMDFQGLHHFAVGMIDRALAAKKGNSQPNVALFARFAPSGAEGGGWVVKQALDLGLMGVIFNDVDDAEQATRAVASMRYPQLKTSKYQSPVGTRGHAPGYALWVWGIGLEEYDRRADVWPLNPDGDLMAIIMIESALGLKNVDKIAATPGVGALFLGQGSDLSRNLGVPQNSPQVEQAFQTILTACKAHNVACGITATTGAMITRRLNEGWKMIRTTPSALQEYKAANPGR